ncbi:MAG: amidohydrolase family protein, partial [Pedobacter sp.]|nr:amidohydrolase family protein [Pedobacter sp.]
MNRFLLSVLLLFSITVVNAQQNTFPVNGSFDVRPGMFAFTNASIVVSGSQTLKNATMLVKGQKIEAIGSGLAVPKGYVVTDLKGKFIYPSLIDAFTSYGLAAVPSASRGRQSIFVSTKKGAYNWNEAIRPETQVNALFSIDEKKAEDLRKAGFGSVNVVSRDGIARGSSAAVTLNDGMDNNVFLNDRTAANYSFNKGSSSNDYPSSLMGAIALLRQTYYDSEWYVKQNQEYNISLEAFGKEQSIPQLFEVDGWQNVLRANKIAKEFGKTYMIKSSGDEYQRIDEIKATGASLIVPLDFPKAYDVEDPADARKVSLTQMKEWEMAPANPAALEKAKINFAITAFGLDNTRDFWANLRTAIDNGLSEKQAFESITEIPAKLLGISDKVGTLEKGKIANFLISSDSLFKKDNIIFENWVQGKRFVVNRMDLSDVRGMYNLNIDGIGALSLKITGSSGGSSAAIERTGVDSVKTTASFNRNGDWVSINFSLKKNPAGNVRLSGYITDSNPITLSGESVLADGKMGRFTASFKEAVKDDSKKQDSKPAVSTGKVIYPFTAFGEEALPKQETVLLKNGTVWTNEQEGILQNADVLIENGKIKAVGKNLTANGATVIDATGKHITSGII